MIGNPLINRSVRCQRARRQRQNRASRFANARKRIIRTGAAVVEFAIVANVVILLIMTCIEFARLNMVRNLAQDAAYFGARQAVVPGATSQEARDVADRIMSSMLSGGYIINVSDINSDSAEVAVTVAIQLHEVALFVPLFLPDSSIQTQAKMRTERYDGFFEQ
jgi:Flp pilus assembly protein TadG